MKRTVIRLAASIVAALMFAMLLAACADQIKDTETSNSTGETGKPADGPEMTGDNGESTPEPIVTPEPEPTATPAPSETAIWVDYTEWGVFKQICVPETMDFLGGTQLDRESEEGFQLTSKENPTYEWIMVDIVDGETAAMSLETTKEMNDGAWDFTLEAGGKTWTGVAYRYADSHDAFQMYAEIGGRTVMIRAFGFAYDSGFINMFISDLELA